VAQVIEAIDDRLRAWIEAQPMFFVGTAAADGHVNISPKGYDTFRVLGPHRVGYLDLTGSGVETIAHLATLDRITFMFCAFSGPPRILRLYGRGNVVLPEDAGWAGAVAPFEVMPGTRAVITADLDRISTSCGYAIPNMTLEGDRPELIRWAERKGDDGVAEYHRTKNAHSIDGLPGMPA